ncbi:MAG: NYN domain-containing protein [Chloroflexi bacterium]|nr:NYN domain-containing protein [Chloroflexota bacterium]
MSGNETDRAVVLVDGMNLFNNAKRAYGYPYPNYDVVKLANAICGKIGCQLAETRFYTGVPAQRSEPDRHHFWFAKSQAMRQAGVIVYTRTVRQTSPPQEKGIDLRIGLDALALAFRRACDALAIVSTDQDFTELNRYVREVANEQGRKIRLISAYPVGNQKVRGINGMEQLPIARKTYDSCIDPTDYRPRRKRRN